jgi:polysaccharide deacetylase 2 family uncharacterized protein YibQ
MSPAGNPNNDDPSAVSLRRETFLAHYPRNLKIAVVLITVAVVSFSVPYIASTQKRQILAQKVANIARSADTNLLPAFDTNTPMKIVTAEDAAKGALLNDQDDRSIKLSPAPEPGLSDDQPEGSLPRISEDGRQPWQVYARPFNAADKRPRIAIIIGDVGLSRVASDAAISRLPPNVTLAFDAQGAVVGAWCARARQEGHETLLAIPMEPFDYPRSDPGSNTLLTTLSTPDNIARLFWALRQSTGYVGVTSFSGSRFTTDPDKLGPVLDILKKRGLMVFDAKAAPHSAVADMAKSRRLPVAIATQRIDQDLSPEALDAALARLEQTARLTGHATGVASPTPLVLERLQFWLKELPRRGFALAPISAMVE